MVKRLSGERRVGHAGTLDPAATGVLPVCLGRGTRVIEFLVDTTKTYHAQIELGVATDTYDGSGQITQQGDTSGIKQRQLKSALDLFRGLIQQTPPMYSAIKHRGQPLYKLARAGIEVERKSRPATIHRLELISWEPPVVTVEIECSKGTYIRSIAHDLGQLLGCGAHLKSLIRTRCGPFEITDTVSISQLEDVFRYGYWQRFVYPVDFVLLHWAAIILSDDTSQAIRNGCPLVFGDDTSAEHCRVYAPDGRFLGLMRFNPEKGQSNRRRSLCSDNG